MQRIGCTGCHVQNLTIRSDRRIADVETQYDPERGIFNDLFAEAKPLFRSVADKAAYPQLQPLGGSFVVENVFTDLKRHDLGPAFHERDFNGSVSRVTSPSRCGVWGPRRRTVTTAAASRSMR